MDQQRTTKAVQPGDFYRAEDEMPASAVEALNRRSEAELRELAAKANRQR